MKKALLVNSLLLALLVSCGSVDTPTVAPTVAPTETPTVAPTETPTVSPTETPTEIPTVSPTETPTEEEIVNPDEATIEKIDEVVNTLKAKNGHPNKDKFIQITALQYTTGGAPIVVATQSIADVVRYKDANDNSIVITNAVTGMYDIETQEVSDKENLILQKTHDNEFIYEITDYETTSENDSLKKTKYLEGSLENFVNIGFGYTEAPLVNYLKRFIDQPDWLAEIRHDEVKDNGVWSLSYRLTKYEKGTKVPSQVITYNDQLTLKDGIIVEAYQAMENALYAGGEKLNMSLAETKHFYQQGDYSIFDGTLLDPKDYKEAK